MELSQIKIGSKVYSLFFRQQSKNYIRVHKNEA